MAEKPRPSRRKPPAPADQTSGGEAADQTSGGEAPEHARAAASAPDSETGDLRAAARRTLIREADDPDTVKAALVSATDMSRNIWIAFLSFGTYLVVAVGAVTHRQLFLEEPIKLPLLSVELPLVGFFVVAPILFLIFHLYLLLHLKLMADKVRRYSELVCELELGDRAERHVRLQLPNFVFVQFLAGPRGASIADWLLMAIAWITVVVGPVLLLLLIQLQFLPYHLEWVTLWVHRVAIVADLLLLWCFWPGILKGTGIGRTTAMALRASSWVISAFIVWFSVIIATFPGESIHERVPFAGRASVHDRLFGRAIDEVRGRPLNWFSNRLVVMDQSFVDPDKLDKVEVSRSFRGRDLRHAVLSGADLRKADFTGARLDSARFVSAKLQHANFGCVTRDIRRGLKRPEKGAKRAAVNGRRDDDCASLQGASFASAQLQGAILVKARLEGTLFERASLQGASLNGARLQGALLRGAQLQGASLDEAQLQGASLELAVLQGATLKDAELEGASLAKALVWRAVGLPKIFETTDVDANAETRSSSVSTFQDWKKGIVGAIPQGSRRDLIEARLELLNPKLATDPEGVIQAEFWERKKAESAQGEERKRKLAEFLAELACKGDAAPFVARALLWNGRIEDTGPHAGIVKDELSKGKSDPSACAGASGFGNFHWRRLDEILDEARKTASTANPVQ
jgi:uncharacterized protein YjbI with pentapeptide repeats